MRKTFVTGNSNNTNGCVCILCNEKTKLAKAEKLKEFWIDTVKCDLFGGKIHRYVNGSELKQMFQKLAELDNASKFYYLVVFIIARGGLVKTVDGVHDVYVSGCDDCWLPENEILSLFHNSNKRWLNKPKFFILDYDRLNVVKAGRLLHIKSNKPAKPLGPRTNPSISDFLLVYGSTKDIITQIRDVFSENYKKKSIMQLLTKVCQNINEGKSPPEIVVQSSLTEYRMHRETRQFRLYPTWYEYMSGASEMISFEDLIADSVEMEECESRPLSKGLVLIVSNSLEPINDNPSGSNPPETASPSGDILAEHEEDSQMMKDLWVDTLKCDPYKDTPYENKSASEMKELLKGIACTNTRAYKYVVVVISAHGGLTKKDDLLQPYFVGCTGRVLEREILHYFMGEKSAWKDKVKIFIFDYCRGKIRDRGVDKADSEDESETTKYETEKYHPEDEILPPSITTMPNNSYVIYSTHVNYRAYANRLTQFIHDVFMEHWDQLSLVEMLTIVNSRMKKAGTSKKAMSIFNTTARDDFCLYARDEKRKDFDRTNSDQDRNTTSSAPPQNSGLLSASH